MFQRIRGSEIGKTGSAAKAWWIEATCSDCGVKRYVSTTTRSEDELLAKKRCAPCHRQRIKARTWRGDQP